MPKVVIKADDLRATENERWQRFVDCCVDNDVPATLGFIAGDADGGAPVDAALLGSLDRPLFEIWNHSYLHDTYGDGKTDFSGRTFEEQLEDLRRTQRVASELFGRAPRAFGPSFNKYDVNTLKAIVAAGCFEFAYDVGYLKGLRTVSKASYVECEGPANGRLFGLDRALQRARPFMLKRADFVLQVHPGNHWEPGCIERFETFVRHLRASGYEFGLTEHL